MLIDSSFKEYFSNDMLFAKIDAESVDSITAQKYKVSGYPTFVLTDSKGEEVDRIVGYLPADEFVQTVKDYQNGIGTLDDLLAKAKDSTDRLLYFDIADKYKYRGAPDDAKVWFEKIIAAGEPTDSLSGESRFALADMLRRNKDYDASVDAFQAIKKDFPSTFFAEGADIYTAICYKAKADTVAAIKAFESFIKEYPESDDLSYAEKQIAKLNGEEEVKKEESSN